MKSEETFAKLEDDLAYRLKNLDTRNGAFWLISEGLSAEYLISFSYPHVLRAIERRGTLVELSSAIGRRLRQKQKLQQDSIAEIQAGWFVVISFIDIGLISYTKEKTSRSTKTSKYRSYVVLAKDWESLKSLIETVDLDNCDMFPVNKTPAPWVPGYPYHSTTGTPIIKKGSSMQLDPFKNPTQEMDVLFRVLNKLSSTGWRINDRVFSVYKAYMDLDDNPEKSPFKYAREIDKKKRKSMLIEAEAVRKLAEKHSNKAFYHLYNFDFRGRIYPNTAFLHEQSSDNAKGILMFDEPRLLGPHGLKWLRIYTANMWGEDKVTLEEREKWVDDNMAHILSYVQNPYSNRGWIKADKPFTFLAACYEVTDVLAWEKQGQKSEDFPSCLPVYIDGSNNGVQHLAAMSRDEEVAPLVNLIPSDEPGDVYMFIADKVWDRLGKMSDDLPKRTRKRFDTIFSQGIDLQSQYDNAPLASDRKRIAYKKLANWKQKHRDIREKLFPVYWIALDPKDRRKTVKRNVMTLGYGGTPYGMGQQVIEDTRSISDYLRDKDYLWGVMLGELVYKTCYEELKGPAAMLRLFETVAERANEAQQPLAWTTPSTGFPVVQEYRKAKAVRVRLRHGLKTLWVQIQVWEEATLNESKQKTGAAPNFVHSLDAAHLTNTVDYCSYPVAVVHDSFGCHAANMESLFGDVRETFYQLHQGDPLKQILVELQSEDLIPERGNLDLSKIKESEFAFA